MEANENSVGFQNLYLMGSCKEVNVNFFYRERTKTVKASVLHKGVCFYSSRYPSDLGLFLFFVFYH